MVLILGKPETSGWVSAMLQSGPFFVGLVGARGMVEVTRQTLRLCKEGQRQAWVFVWHGHSPMPS